jgi:hypothetical protein
MDPAEKHVNEMNRLTDMLHFPVAVNAGATLNVLLTAALTWHIEPRHPAFSGPWIALVLALNLLPVILLRLSMGPGTVYPALREMDFFRDQQVLRLGVPGGQCEHDLLDPRDMDGFRASSHDRRSGSHRGLRVRCDVFPCTAEESIDGLRCAIRVGSMAKGEAGSSPFVPSFAATVPSFAAAVYLISGSGVGMRGSMSARVAAL